MRKNKFKVWDKEQEKFLEINWEDEETRLNKGKAILRYTDEYGLYVTLSGYRDEDGWPYEVDADILEYTGLKDRNGNEIYEGYILEDKEHMEGEPFEGIEKRFVVEWLEFECGFAFKRLNTGIYENSSDLVNNDTLNLNLEIVGNIYENPELI